LRKQCAKFHQNCQSFIEDITEYILVSLFSGHTVLPETDLFEVFIVLFMNFSTCASTDDVAVTWQLYF